MTSASRGPEVALDVVVLGGGGHVGLPLSLAFAKAGLRVGIVDIDESKLASIGRGEMPFLEAGAEHLLNELLPTGRIELSASPEMLRRTRQVIAVVGTPIDEFLNPSMTVFAQRRAPLAWIMATVMSVQDRFVDAGPREEFCRVGNL